MSNIDFWKKYTHFYLSDGSFLKRLFVPTVLGKFYLIFFLPSFTTMPLVSSHSSAISHVPNTEYCDDPYYTQHADI